MIEVLKQIVEALEWCHGGEPIGTAEAIQAGKKLIAELESQEPVAWRIKVETKLRDGSVDVGYQLRNEKLSAYDEPLYTHPPQRTEQEPVKYEHKAYTMPPQPEQKTSADDFFKTIADKNPKPFPPSQRTWVGLTDEEKHKTWYEMQNIMGWYSFQEIVQAIEARLKDKNT